MMQYRRFGRLDWRASALGFGCMRLPVVNSDPAAIDIPQATRMLHYAIDHGVTYIDSAYGYHGGNSERFLGEALKGGYRHKVRLATKMPAWMVQSADDFDRFLNEQLAKLQTDHIDFYLLHGLGAERWRKVHDLGVLDWLPKPLADGRIGHVGFSFHDTYDVFKEIVDAYDWTLCQIQYNYMDIENQAGNKGLHYAAARGLAVVVMEPILGGKLAKPPAEIQGIWDTAARQRTAADWALQWVWNQPEVSLALSGMSTMQQVEENIVSAANSSLNSLTVDELALYERVRAAYRRLSPIPCTGCRYCMPCPNGVDIPRNFGLFNDGKMYGQPEIARRGYAFMLDQMKRGMIKDNPQASECLHCRECEDNCPQHIPISEWMPIVHAVLGEGRPYDDLPTPAGPADTYG